MARDTTNLEKTAGLGLREADVLGAFSLPARELVGEDPEDGRGQASIEHDHASELTGQREDMIGSLGLAFAPVPQECGGHPRRRFNKTHCR